jgi:hypothetical protein
MPVADYNVKHTILCPRLFLRTMSPSTKLKILLFLLSWTSCRLLDQTKVDHAVPSQEDG